MDVPSRRWSCWIRHFLVAVVVAGCGSDASEAPTTSIVVKSITLIGPADSLSVGQSYQMTAIDEAGRTIGSSSVVWSSSAPSVATVTGDGLATARGLGVATITATMGSLRADFVVNVGTAKIVLQIAGAEDSLVVGETYTLSARIFSSTGGLLGAPQVTWGSSNPAVASVSSSGALTVHMPGEATITATAEAIAGAIVVHVKNAHLLSTILPDGEFGDTVQIAPGESLQLGALAYYDAPGRPTTPTGQVTWSSSDSGIATVSQSGRVTGASPGYATITANLLQHPATRTLRVATTSGTATIRLVGAADDYYTVTMHPNVGVPATLAYGAVSEQVVPAGTLQLSFDGIPPLITDYDPSIYATQVFLGFLPAGAHETFVAVSNMDYASYSGPVNIAWLDDRTEPVPADSSLVRVVLATPGGHNVFFTDPGASATLPALSGCYLDWPFGYTAYSGRSPGAFDIVLQTGKFSNQGFGKEAARFHVTATAGHAMTFILTGQELALRLVSVVDR